MFRLVNVDGRAALEHEGAWYDLASLSDDVTLSDPLAAVGRHRELHPLHALVASGGASSGGAIADTALGPPVANPKQSFGIGLNYKDHAAEAHADTALPP